MRLSLLATCLIVLMTLPAEAARPVKGAVQGTTTAATGVARGAGQAGVGIARGTGTAVRGTARGLRCVVTLGRSEEHTSELQSLRHLVCRLLLEKKKIT